jgi:hypothetical protein
MLRRAASFARSGCLDVVHKDAHDEPAHRRYEQHAIVRYCVAIVLGLRDAGSDIVRHGMQLDRGRQLDTDVRVEGRPGLLTLESLIDRAALLVSEQLERVCQRDELIVGDMALPLSSVGALSVSQPPMPVGRAPTGGSNIMRLSVFE